MSRFLRDQKGAVTIEFTVIVPLFVLLLVFFADASVIYLTHSEMFSAARDVARRMSTGEIKSTEEARAYAAEHLFLGQRTYIIDPNFETSTVTVAVSVRDAAIFGAWFKPIIGQSIIVRSTMGSEPLN